MKMSEIAELKEARRRALGAELIVADKSSVPTSKSSKGRCGRWTDVQYAAMQSPLVLLCMQVCLQVSGRACCLDR